MNWIRNHLERRMLLLLALALACGCRSASKTDLGDYQASMAVKRIACPDQQPDQYLVDILVWRQRADGIREIIAAPQIIAIEGKETSLRVGSDAVNYMLILMGVDDRDGRKIGTANVECFADGAMTWQKKLQAEATPASN